MNETEFTFSGFNFAITELQFNNKYWSVFSTEGQIQVNCSKEGSF